jgi:hypothetical protein
VHLRLRLSLLALHPSRLPSSRRFSSTTSVPATVRPLSLRRGSRCRTPLRATQGEAAVPEGFEDELGRLLELLPGELRRRVEDHPERPALVEVVMDLGRPPLARFPSGDFLLSDRPISFEDLDQATAKVDIYLYTVILCCSCIMMILCCSCIMRRREPNLAYLICFW